LRPHRDITPIDIGEPGCRRSGCREASAGLRGWIAAPALGRSIVTVQIRMVFAA